MAGSERVVLDTNVVLSALVFGGGAPARLRMAWREGRIVPLVSQETVTELAVAIAYPKFRLTEGEREELLADYLPFCRAVAIPSPAPKVPRCRDARDRPFLELAVVGRATTLVTGDRDLLALSEKVGFSIMTPAEFDARSA